VELCIYNLCQKTTFTQHLLFLSKDNHDQTHRLDELSDGVEEGGDTGGTERGTVGDSSTAGGAGAGRAGRAGASARLAAGGGGVVLLGDTLVGTADDIATHLVEGVTVELAVGGLQVEATSDLSEGTELDTGNC
jgi:hypothetical protein